MPVEKVIIIGSGPAGLTAAIYAARANLEPLVVEGLQAGGQLMTTTDVDNFPGFPEGILGPDLMQRMRQQAERFCVRFAQMEVTRLDLSKRPFRVEVDADVYETETLLIATGATSRRLGIPSEDPLWGRGISGCATCDAFFFRNKDVLVVGGGDTALEDALVLARTSRSVRVIHRRGELRASQAMQDKAKETPNLSFVWHSVVVECMATPEGKFAGAKVRDVRTGEMTDLKADGLFVAIGHIPMTDLVKGQLALDRDGYIVTEPGTPRTSVRGVFAAGDVQDSRYRQAITAAGSGCMAALELERFLSEGKD